MIMSGCSVDRSCPEFKKLNTREFDVLELKFDWLKNVAYTDVGDIKDGKFHLNGTYLKYSGSRTNNFTGKVETSAYVCSVPDNFWQNVKNDKGEIICEGIIVFERVPFSFYYNEDGEPYVKCLETRFHSYFKEDRSYVDFINFAVNYQPVNYSSNEDTLSS